MKSKKTYKIIACVSIWLSVIIAFFCLALAKPKAGVIVESSFGNFTTFQGANAADLQGKYFGFNYFKFYGSFEFQGSWSTGSGTTSGAMFQIRDIGFVNDKAIMHARWSQQTSWDSSIQCYFTTYNNTTYVVFDILQLISNVLADGGTQAANITILSVYSSGLAGYNPVICEISNTISQIENIFDLSQNDVALIYLSDISGLDTTAYRDEITINWGYIDSTDNTLYAVHAPTVQAQRTDNNIISLAMPVNAAGDATSYYTIDQSAILSTISAGGATATAHIYGVYVWIQQARIQWGLAEFDTSGLPASGASMNYITSLTSLYDFTANNTSTMTCRLSISNNFNFITIKNQPILSAYNINTVIQQGGFLPAWAVYNWARGSSAGYTSGEQAGAAPYQPGGTGYQEIYEAGRQAGIAENIGTVNWFVSAFNAVDAMLNIRIFPNITIGYLVGIPFVISVVWFIIRMFRGGGSSS